MSPQETLVQPRFEGVVSPAFPLALLASVRSHDHPGEVFEEEDLSVSLPRRLGLTGIFETQIMRYEAAQRARKNVRFDEVVSLIRLVLRRPDAEPILRETGQRVARWHFSRISSAYGFTLRHAPLRMRARAARRGARRLLTQLQPGSRVVVTKPFTVHISDPATAVIDAVVPGCSLVTALLEEQYLLFTGQPARFDHAACATRGSDGCAWTMETSHAIHSS